MSPAGDTAVVTPFVQDADFTLWNGDVRDVLAQLPAESVDCCVTSPPYWGLRDYNVDGQLGLEATPDEYVAALVDVFREVRRVLSDAGTVWLNLGDSYASDPGKGGSGTPTSHGLKQKDLCGIPWRVAFALQADGWYLRSDIIWAKPNPMPESVTDRPTKAHEYVFLLSKSPRYYFDADAIAEPAEWARWGNQTNAKYEGTQTSTGWMQPRTKAELDEIKTKKPDGWATHEGGHGSFHRGGREAGEKVVYKSRGRSGNGQRPRTDERRGFDEREDRVDGLKNPRSVWTIPTEGYPEAHFATWPQALVERILKAGCPEGGVCLDPFMGSGTTALVARRLGRKSVGIELNPDYCALAAKRLGQQSLLMGEVA